MNNFKKYIVIFLIFTFFIALVGLHEVYASESGGVEISSSQTEQTEATQNSESKVSNGIINREEVEEKKESFIKKHGVKILLIVVAVGFFAIILAGSY